MFEQLTQLVQQFGNDAVVKNDAIPKEHNKAVMNEASSSILSGLQNIASNGGAEQLARLLQGNNASNSNNPIVKQLTEQLTGSLGAKFGLNNAAASSVAGSLIPKVLSSLINKAKDPNDSSFQVSDLINSIGGGNSSLMDAVSKYGGIVGLDQDGDGKVGIEDAMAAATKKNGGLGGLLGKLFGK